jgi:alpha-amylase
VSLLALVGLSAAAPPARARVLIQYFETPYTELQSRAPEVLMAGYDAMWLPPPTKGAEGTRDVGFSVFDRFDLGDRDQRGTIPTRYGSRDQLVAMVQQAHRMGLRVIFDVVMNHVANPSLIENPGVTLQPVPLDGFPGLSPLDFHVLPANSSDGGVTYDARLPAAMGGGTLHIAPGSTENPEAFVAAVPMPAADAALFPGYAWLVRAPRIDFNTAALFELQNESLLGLADIADEQIIDATTGMPAATDGTNNMTEVALPSFIRLPNRPETYPSSMPVTEDPRQFLIRWIRWLGDVTDCDGFRLDAVKHTPTQFFANDFTGDPIAFNQAIEDDYHARRGIVGDKNPFDGVNDAQIFGEDFSGDYTGDLAAYYGTGMQMLNFPLFFTLGSIFSQASAGGADIGQLSFPHGGAAGAYQEFGGLGRAAGVSFVQSHDSAPPDLQANAAYAFTLTRVGDSVVFFDGNNKDPRDFVQPGRPDALGELGSDVITGLVYVHNHFARGGMFNRFVDNNAYVYERVVTGEGATLLAVITDNVNASDSRVSPDGAQRFGGFDPRPLIVTAFPPGTVLRDYTGNSPLATTTVLDPATLPANQVSSALAAYANATSDPVPTPYGLVPLAVPDGPDHGYAMYAPVVPQGPSDGERPVAIWQGIQRVPDVPWQTDSEKHTAAGLKVPARVLELPKVTGKTIALHVRTDTTAAEVFARLDQPGQTLGAATPVGNTPEMLFDGMVSVPRSTDAPGGDHTWVLPDIDVSALTDGVHVVVVRAAEAPMGSQPVFFNTFVVPFVVSHDLPPLPDPNADPDRDRDGVPNPKDDCPDTYDPPQSDFDGDGVGDVCDLCPLSPSGVMVDRIDGCRPLTDTESADLASEEAAALGQQPGSGPPATDPDNDGQVDIVDLVDMVDALPPR